MLHAFEVNVIYIIITCGLIGVIRTLTRMGGLKIDLFTNCFWSFIQIRNVVQLWRRVCSHATDPGQVVNTWRVADYDRVYGSGSPSLMTPGPIAVNSATFVGMKIAGFPGSFVATLGCILAVMHIIVTILAKLYLKYRNLDTLQEYCIPCDPAVSMIASAGVLIYLSRLFGKWHYQTLMELNGTWC